MRALSMCVGALFVTQVSSMAWAETVRLVGATTFNSEIMEPYKEQIEKESGQKFFYFRAEPRKASWRSSKAITSP